MLKWRGMSVEDVKVEGVSVEDVKVEGDVCIRC